MHYRQFTRSTGVRSGTPVLVGSDHVVAVEPARGSGTIIHLPASAAVEVSEPYEDVCKWLIPRYEWKYIENAR